jgi:hypothetical protein
MAFGDQQPQGAPDNGAPVPPNPVQPGSGVPTNDPATNPSAPVNAPPGNTGQPVPENQEQVDRLAEAQALMAGGDANDFLTNFLQGEGMVDERGVQPPNSPAGQQQVPAGSPGNVPQGAPNGTSPALPPQQGQQQAPPQQGQVPGVRPDLLQRMMQPQPSWPMAPAPTQAAPPQAAPQQQQPAQPGQPWTPFTEAFQLPPQLAEALNHDDPNIRASAVGSAMAAAGNRIAQTVLEHVQAQVLPQYQQQTVNQVQQAQFVERVQSDLYGKHPNLRYASPQLLAQAAQVVVQDEAMRNPNATYSAEIMDRIGQLATAAMQQLAMGQTPTFQPPQQPGYYPQQQPAYYPQQAPQQAPPYAWAYPQAYPQQQQQMPQGQPPYVAPMAGQQFGVPQNPAPTPESEFQSLANGW